MSSEDSGEDNIGGDTRQVIYVNVLPWRAPKVDSFFKSLDHKASKNKSHQSRQQTLPWGHSKRPKPFGFVDDFLGFAAA